MGQQPHAFAFALNRRREMMATTMTTTMTTMRMAPARRSPAGVVQRRNPTKAMLVRPYTVRKGDTVFKISQKRDVKIEDILSVNHGLRKDTILEGQTILLPSSKLSERDREILDGVGKGKGKYRAYPVRKVEVINEGVDLSSLKAYQAIKLPRNKYTEREKEMLVGAARVPVAFFSMGSGMSF